jgi:hypothetical protein
VQEKPKKNARRNKKVAKINGKIFNGGIKMQQKCRGNVYFFAKQG